MKFEIAMVRAALERRKTAPMGSHMLSAALIDAAFSPVLEMVDQIAAMRTDEETPSGMSGDDAAETLGSLITWARQISDVRPDPATVCPDASAEPKARSFSFEEVGRMFGLKLVEDGTMPPNAVELVQGDQRYRFTIDLQGPICTPCSGTGEVIEFPPDDDERMVVCPACGGTGEAPIHE